MTRQCVRYPSAYIQSNLSRLGAILVVTPLLSSVPAFAGAPYDESVDGDLSDDPAAPTVLAITPGANQVAGEVNLSNDLVSGDRDFLSFTVPNGQTITDINLTAWNPDNLGFFAVNAGATGFIPSGATSASFLAGILPASSNVGTDLLVELQNNSVTTNSLADARLVAGDYTFVIQQTSDLIQEYGLNFVLTETSRQVQIRSVDFEDGIIELFNFGEFDEDLTGWRFCSHDFDQGFRYTSSVGFNGVTIETGTSVFVHFNNDAPGGDPDRINRSTLGGGFATPLDQDAYGLQIYFPAQNGSVSFGNSALIGDHLQWNIDGAGVGSAESRTGQAVSQSLWTTGGDFIATESDSTRIDLIDLSGDVPGAPSEYEVAAAPDTCEADLDGDGSVGATDLAELLGTWTQVGVPADFFGNGVGADDLAELLGFWGPCP